MGIVELVISYSKRDLIKRINIRDLQHTHQY